MEIGDMDTVVGVADEEVDLFKRCGVMSVICKYRSSLLSGELAA
jgi:hypothetical protein